MENHLLYTSFIKQAQRFPEKIALVNGIKRLSYGELLSQAQQWANLLMQQSVQNDHLIAIFMDQSWEQCVAMLGILFAGAAYLPIDPNWPRERVAALLKLGEVSIVVTQAAYRDYFQGAEVSVHVMGEEVLPSAEWSDIHVQPQNLAYVMFTSGSTGQPKGVAIQHGAVMNTINDINTRFAICRNDAVLSLSAFHFDLSVYDFFGLLAVGGKIVLPLLDERLDPAAWLRLIRDEEITLWNSVPALVSMLLEMNGKAPLPCSLRVMLLSGDIVPMALIKTLQHRFPVGKIVSLGGATEASIWSVLYEVKQLDPNWRSIPYGQAMMRQTVAVLRDDLSECQRGEQGEIYIGGVGLAREYWRDPLKTQDRFVTHPITQQRLYRTGDWGRYLKTGLIEFLGRKDFQVKIKGHRIELAEIEINLMQHPEVQQAVVLTDQKHLYAFVTGVEGATESNDLLHFAAARLPAYMIPRKVFWLRDFPLTTNGKIDRCALQRQLAMLQNSQAAHSTPAWRADDLNPVERCILQLWQETLASTSPSLDDHFFDQGGDSLSAARLIGGINQHLNHDLPVAVVFENPTLRSLMQKAQLKSAAPKSPLVQMSAGGAKQMILIHPVSGQIFCYNQLVKALAGECSCFALEAKANLTFSSLERRAAQYCDALRSANIKGPYYLAGWSIGGLIAFEMAHQLGSDQVAFLGLFDTYPALDLLLENGISLSEAAYVKTIAHYYCQEVSKILQCDIALDLTAFTKIHPLTAIEQTFSIIQRQYAQFIDPHRAFLEGFTQEFKVILNEMIGYRSKNKYVDQMALFYVEDAPVKAMLLWQKQTLQSLTLQAVSGNHLTLLASPHVYSLAQHLKRYLDEVSL